jgi:uracil phosphoribosyltransferase
MSNSQQNLSQYEMHDIICECHLCANKHTANIQKMRDELDTYIQMMRQELDVNIYKMREDLDANIQIMRDELDTYIQMMNDEREAYIKKYVEQYNKIQ